jgi:dihydrofolate reductase
VPRVFVIGGAQVYALAMPRADELVLTEIDRDFDGDTHFPDWPRAQFDVVAHERHQRRPTQRLRLRVRHLPAALPPG